MTTIAYDTKEIVSDSQSTLGDICYEEDCQKLFPNVGPFAIIGIVGNFQHASEVIDYIQDFTRLEQILNLDFDELEWDCGLLGLTHKGELWSYNGKRSCRLRNDIPYALGSGGDFALGAMFGGASAREAVIIASRLDLMTNDVIQVASISTEEELKEEEKTIH